MNEGGGREEEREGNYFNEDDHSGYVAPERMNFHHDGHSCSFICVALIDGGKRW